MSLLARDIMQPHVVTVSPDTTLAAVADLLINQRISGVPVVEGGAIVGIVSRSDFARLVSLERTLAGLATEAEGVEEYAPGELPAPLPPPGLTALMEGRAVRDVMTPSPLVVSPEAPIDQVADLLVRRHVHRVLVADAAGLHGVISALDVLRLVADGRLREN